MKREIEITGLDCVACAEELAEEIRKVKDVNSCDVSFMNQKIVVDYDGDLLPIYDIINNFEECQVKGFKEIVYKIENLDCASCAEELNDELKNLKGVINSEVNFLKQEVKLNVSSEASIEEIEKTINGFEEVKICKLPSKKTLIKVKNIDCASCALELQDELSKLNGVDSCNVNFLKQEISLDLNNEASLDDIKNHINHFEEVKVVEDNQPKKKNSKRQRNIILIAIAAILFIVGIVMEYTLGDNLWYVSMIFYLLCFFIVGYPVLINTVKNLAKGHIFDENFLMTLASIGAMCISQFEEGAAVMLLYQIGELLQDIAVNSSRNEISSLMDLKSIKANLYVDGKIKEIAPEELKIGDTIVIKNGEKVPTDCLLSEGETSFDTKSLTGEALPRDLKEGDEVLGGFINLSKTVKATVKKEYHDSSVAKILSLVEDSSAVKAAPEKFITKFARYYTPIVVCLALVLGLIVPLIVSLVQQGNYAENYSSFIYRALTMLVISCPCALIISVPLTYFNGIGVSAKNGILIKGATYLDNLSKADIYAFDKTGTLTKGEFTIIKHNLDENVLQISAAIEKNSNHPIARAFDKYDQNILVTNVKEIAGLGIEGDYQGHHYQLGNEKMMKDIINFEKLDSLSTVIYVSEDNKYLGYVEIDDEVKKEAAAVMDELKALGVKKLVMLTGDNPLRGEKVAKELHLDEVKGGLLPEGKLLAAKDLRKEGVLLYVGDGINDAPVMLESDIAVSMGKLGSDAAIEASDVVLIKDDLRGLVKSKKLAKKTRQIVYQNIIGSIFLKIVFMVLGVLNIIPLAIAVFADVGVMLLAVLNSLRMRIGGK